MQVGDKICFEGEKQRYTVQALNGRYIIATKPFNARRTYLYTIVDLERGVRGPDNLVLGSFHRYDNPQGAQKNLDNLVNGVMEVSYRRCKALTQTETDALSIVKEVYGITE